MFQSLRSRRLLSAVALQTFFTLVLSTFGSALPALVPIAEAASVDVTTIGLMNGSFPGAPVPLNSSPIAVVKLTVTADSSVNLTSVQVNFSGTGFANSDLLGIATATSSGVSLYQDNGTTVGSFDAQDQVVRLAGTPDWTPSTSNIILTPASTSTVALSTTAKILYVAIRTSGTGTNGDTVVATIPAGGVIASGVSGLPASAFIANYVTIDASTPALTSCEGSAGSATLFYRFNRPVQKAGGGPLVAASLAYTSGGGGQTISSVSHEVGRDYAMVTLSGVLVSADLDGTPGNCAVASGQVVSMSGPTLGTTPVDLSSPLGITTPNIPSATAGTTYNSGSPLVTFDAVGGSGTGYFFSPANDAATSTLTTLGLALGATTKKITGTVASVTGSFTIGIKVTDSLGASSTRNFTINVVGSGGGSVPGIASVSPPGGPQNTTTMTVNVVGSNTTFTSASQISFLMPPGVSGTNGVSTTTSATVTVTDPTHISFPVTIGASAAVGSRDLRIQAGSQTMTLPNAFTVFASGGGSGLNQLLPADSSTGVPTVPVFSFSQSSNSSVVSYQLRVFAGSSVDSTVLWNYASPKTLSETTSHCSATQCNITYGNLRFMAITPPSTLVANTTYYWQVVSHSTSTANISSATVVESTPLRSFTTISTVSDTVAPSIFHFNINQVPAGAALKVFAKVMDNVATESSSPALVTKILHCQGNGCTPTTEVLGAPFGNGYYRFIVPAGAGGVGTAGTNMRYILRATDGTNTFNFPPGGVTTTAATAGSGTISGTIQDSAGTCSVGVQGTTVFAAGTGASSTTDGSCNFTLSGLFPGTYQLVAFKAGYGDMQIQGIPTGMTSLTVRLGASGSGGGFGGDTTQPRVQMTCPMDASRNMPGGDSNFKLCVVFNKAMSESTITASGGLVVKDITAGANTNITSNGTWTYYSTAPNTPGIPSMANMALFSLSGSNTFGDDKTIAVSVSRSVTDTSGNSVQGNQPDGSYAFSFSTGRAYVAGGGGVTFGSGAFIPPRVNGATPGPGTMDAPTNGVITVNFSEAMADDTSPSYVLANFIKLFPVSDTTETSRVSTVSLDSTKRIATLTLSSSLVASTSYRIKVLGGAKASTNITLSATPSAVVYMSDFRTGTGTDTTVPTLVGSFPDNNATNVPVNLGAVSVAFNTSMDASTITTNSFYLSVGSSAVNGSVEYRPLERRAFFTPLSSLSATSTYTLNLTTDVKASNGTALATAVARTFTTGGADTTAPQCQFMNVDDHAISLTFSEPVVAASILDSINWDFSIRNALVYDVVKYGAAGFDPSAAGTTLSLSSARFTWDAPNNSVLIENIDLSAVRGQELYLSLDGSGANRVKDTSGNFVATCAVRSSIRNSTTTGGAVSPGALASGSDFGGGGSFAPTNFADNATIGFMRSPEARPMTPEAGVTSKYFIRLPLSSALAAGDIIQLTFPVGTDVSGARQDLQSPSKADWNMGAPGTPTFRCTGAAPRSCATGSNSDDTGAAQGGSADDGVVVNATARMVKVYISAATNNPSDFLNIDLDGIVNPTVPLGFGTTGYKVDIKTLRGTTLKESMTSQPFFIQASRGSNTVSGTLTLTGNSGTCDVMVYLMSPTSGMRSTTVSFTGSATANYSFSNIGSGDVFLNTDRSVTCGVDSFTGKTIPERISVSGNTSYNMTLAAATGGSLVSVSFVITGGNGKSVDVFAGSPSDFRVRSITLSSSPQTVTLALPDGFSGFASVGPQMPSGFNTNGPPAAPDYVIPRPKEVRISGTSCLIDGTSGCTANFTLTAASKTIQGVVKDGNDRTMSNVPVFAYSQGGFGAGGMSGADGKFSIPVADGTFNVGANWNGIQSRTVPVVVTSDATTYLLINGATTAITPTAASTTFVLKLAKPECTITGTVTDGTGVLQNAGVFARLTTGPGFANAMTDSSGNYTLYVSCTGVWEVKSFAPGYGELSGRNVTMAGSSISAINFSPALTGTFYTVSGRVYNDRNSNNTWDDGTEQVVGAFVRVRNSTNFNECITDTTGSYSCRVPAGSGYKVSSFISGQGNTSSTESFAVAADVTGQDIKLSPPNTVTFAFSTTTAEGFVDLVSSIGLGNHGELRNATSVVVTVPNGSYQVKLNVPGTQLTCSDVAGRVGTAFTAGTCALTVDGSEVLDVTLPTLRTISGTVSDGSAGIGAARVEIVQISTGIVVGAQANSAGVFSLKVPDGSYTINAMKSGYIRQPSTLTVTADMSGQTLTMTQSTLSISGRVYLPGGSTGAANAFVRAIQQGTSAFTGTQADGSGNYTLPVTAGTWRLTAIALGYQETALTSNPAIISASSLTGADITLSGTVSLNPATSQTIASSNGGTVEDTTAGASITIPPNAMTSDGSSVVVSIQETNAAPDTSKVNALPGFEFSAQSSDGTAITNFNSNVTIEMQYTPAELAAQTAPNGTPYDTLSEINTLQFGSYDQSSNTYSTLATTVTCEDSSNHLVASPSSPSDCNHFSLAAVTNHFSTYAPVGAAEGAPTTPSGLAGTGVGTTQINLTWTAVSGATSYDIYRSTSAGGTFTRVGSEPTVSSGSTTGYSNTGLSAGTTYYYKITALNGSGESDSSSAVSASTLAETASSGGGGSTSAGSSGLVVSTPTVTPTVPVVTTPPITTAPVVRTPTPVVTPAPAATAKAPVVVPVPVTAGTAIKFSSLVDGAVFAPGAKMQFTYRYVNASGKAQDVRILRQILDAKGKAVKTSNGSSKLKAGAAWDGKVKEALAKNVKPGEYQVVITITDRKSGKVLSKNQVPIVVAVPIKVKKPVPTPAPKAPVVKPPVKVVAPKAPVVTPPAKPPVIVPPPAAPVEAGIHFNGIVDGATLTPGQPLQFVYSYGNTSKSTQDVAIVRELVDADGNTVQSSKATAKLKAGQGWNATVKDKLSKSLKPGTYSLIITVQDRKTGETLNENAVFVQVK